MEAEMTVAATTITCCHEGCGIVFAVPAWWEQNRRKDHTWWFCPNGHQQHFSGKTAEEKKIQVLKEQLATQRSNADWWRRRSAEESEAKETARRSLRATKGVLTKTRRRIATGTCPCCHRHFSNVQQHMATKHPDWPAPAPEQGEQQ